MSSGDGAPPWLWRCGRAWAARRKKMPIRHAEGLRISFVVVDDEGFIFASPPLLVEESRADLGCAESRMLIPESRSLMGWGLVMPAPLSRDLRERIVEACEGGSSMRRAAARF